MASIGNQPLNLGGDSGSSYGIQHRSNSTPFELYNNEVFFAPFFYPTRITVGKSHNLSRNPNVCGTEDVSNTSSKNREVHIVGLLRESERFAFQTVQDEFDPLNLLSLPWSGEVQVKEAELEGPVGFDPHTNEYHFKYTLDLVSTGLDEPGETYEVSGIIDKGNE